MFKRILVPLDGSKQAEQALPIASHLAKTSGGSLLLLRVVSTFNEFGMYSAGMSAAKFLQEALDKELTEAAAYLAKLAHVPVTEKIETRIAVYNGQAASSILDIAQEQEIDVIVLCSHGYNSFKRWALGSVAQKVARHSPTPVLLLRGQNLKLKEKLAHPLRATLALDGSPFAEAALLPAVDIVTALSSPERGELHLLRLVEVPPPDEEFGYMLNADFNFHKTALQEAGEYLQDIRARLLDEQPTRADLQISWSTTECQDIADAIVQGAAFGKGIGPQKASDLIVLTTHGRSGLHRWLVGSVTERVLQSSTLPLLILHFQGTSASSIAKAEATGQRRQDKSNGQVIGTRIRSAWQPGADCE